MGLESCYGAQRGQHFYRYRYDYGHYKRIYDHDIRGCDDTIQEPYMAGNDSHKRYYNELELNGTV
jgi:hypothetical protein